MDLLELTIVIVAITLDLTLGVVVLQRNSHSKTHRLFASAVVAMVAWLIANFMCDQPLFYTDALFLNRLAVAAALVMAIPLLAFVACYPRKYVSLSWAWRLGLLPLAGFAAVSLATPLIVQSVSLEPWGTNVQQGPLFPALVAYGVALTVVTASVSVRRFRAADARQRVQLKYLYLGLALFFTTALFIGALLPMLTGTNELAKLLPLTTLLLLVPTGYAIVRHELMDVQLVVLRSIAYSVLLLVFGSAIVLASQIAQSRFATHPGITTDVFIFFTGLATVLAFQYVRDGLKYLTDRFFYRRTYDPTKLLNGVGRRLASTVDEQELAAVLSHELAERMRLGFATVAFQRDDDTVVVSSDGSYHGPDLMEWLESAEDRRSIVIADALETDDASTRTLTEAGIRVLAPLQIDGVLLGALALGAKRSGTMYSEQDIEVLEALLPEASIAMRNAHLLGERNERVRELTALNRLAFSLGRSIDLEEVLDGALEQVVAVTGGDSGSIMLLDAESGTLSIAASLGVDDRIVESTCIPIGEGIAGWVAANCEPLALPSGASARISREMLRDDVASAICAPVVSKGGVIGVLSVNRHTSGTPFTDENLHVVTSFAGQLGIAIENARLYADLEKTFLGTISALAAAVDAKDPYTFGHSNEVTAQAVAIAEHMGLDDTEIQMIRIAATLHDIGKIGIDGSILLKPGKLDAEEREVINRHPAIGADILAPLEFLRDAVPLVLFHHERHGGGGYPSGISGEAIPLGARIIAVADSYNAMVSDRPYRKGLSAEAATDELRRNAGTQFDPEVVAAFLDIISYSPMTTALRE